MEKLRSTLFLILAMGTLYPLEVIASSGIPDDLVYFMVFIWIVFLLVLVVSTVLTLNESKKYKESGEKFRAIQYWLFMFGAGCLLICLISFLYLAGSE